MAITILGPFGITGAESGLQPKQAELVLRPGARRAGRADELGPVHDARPNEDSPKPPDSLRQIITRTRRKLGTTPSGGEYILHTGNARYVLDPAAQLDGSRFRELAEADQVQRNLGQLRDAIGLLAGQPLDGVHHWWIEAAPSKPSALRSPTPPNCSPPWNWKPVT